MPSLEMSKIVIGAMRYEDRSSAVATIHAAIDAGFNYIDTSPCYCRADEAENSEAWVGQAVRTPGYRERVMVSTKCTPGNGGMELGDFEPEGGFGVRSVDKLNQVFAQSLRRLGLDRVDYYHLWTTHTQEQFDEAFRPGGWYDGVMGQADNWDHLGLTTHADAETIIKFLESGKFETVTMPLNVINTIRLRVVDYCRDRGIKVVAMNPLAGGLLAAREDIKELAFRYLMRLEGVHALIGFTDPEHVAYAKWIVDTMDDCDLTAEQMVERVAEMMDTSEPRCTACGYCLPCPQDITVGAALSFYNVYKYLNMPEAKETFNNTQWQAGLRLDKCTYCGLCQKRCPNGLPVTDLIRRAQAALYD
ncbi:MAG: aldo/keto reductase [Planctomycetota bacterium]|jgi:predicted aldo/keto reductase-like oxidoreductase